MATYNHANNQIDGLDRCPHCGIASPRIALRDQSIIFNKSWGLYSCESCFSGIMVESTAHRSNTQPSIVQQIYPSVQQVPDDLPAKAKVYLTQAISTLHSPDGAAMLLGSTVDAMLKDKGLSGGSVYTRIDQAKTNGLLTEEMAEWAHSVRLGSNRPRHADADDAHVSPEEASQALEYVMTLAQLLYVLPNRIAVGKARATQGG